MLCSPAIIEATQQDYANPSASWGHVLHRMWMRAWFFARPSTQRRAWEPSAGSKAAPTKGAGPTTVAAAAHALVMMLLTADGLTAALDTWNAVGSAGSQGDGGGGGRLLVQQMQQCAARAVGVMAAMARDAAAACGGADADPDTWRAVVQDVEAAGEGLVQLAEALSNSRLFEGAGAAGGGAASAGLPSVEGHGAAVRRSFPALWEALEQMGSNASGEAQRGLVKRSSDGTQGVTAAAPVHGSTTSGGSSGLDSVADSAPPAGVLHAGLWSELTRRLSADPTGASPEQVQAVVLLLPHLQSSWQIQLDVGGVSTVVARGMMRPRTRALVPTTLQMVSDYAAAATPVDPAGSHAPGGGACSAGAGRDPWRVY